MSAHPSPQNSPQNSASQISFISIIEVSPIRGLGLGETASGFSLTVHFL
jgi:hypothetical protein